MNDDLKQTNASNVLSALDTISRQAAQDFISTMNACNDISDEAYQELMVYFENLPSAQQWIPVVHGHWKEDPSGYGFWICSACGFVSEASAADMLYKFCPVCGAKMDGKDGEQK